MFFCALGSCLLLSACSGGEKSATGTQIGQMALSFSVPRLGGVSEQITGHSGKVVLVNLWATWCPPCRDELPALERVAETEKSRAIIIGIDQGDDEAKVMPLVRSLNLRYDILLDRSQNYGANYATIGLPTSLVLDRTGRIRVIFNGAQDEREFEKVIEEVDKAAPYVKKS
jgi:thiol-disulfide isomerase/thioredoxin